MATAAATAAHAATSAPDQARNHAPAGYEARTVAAMRTVIDRAGDDRPHAGRQRAVHRDERQVPGDLDNRTHEHHPGARPLAAHGVERDETDALDADQREGRQQPPQVYHRPLVVGAGDQADDQGRRAAHRERRADAHHRQPPGGLRARARETRPIAGAVEPRQHRVQRARQHRRQDEHRLGHAERREVEADLAVGPHPFQHHDVEPETQVVQEPVGGKRGGRGEHAARLARRRPERRPEPVPPRPDRHRHHRRGTRRPVGPATPTSRAPATRSAGTSASRSSDIADSATRPNSARPRAR